MAAIACRMAGSDLLMRGTKTFQNWFSRFCGSLGATSWMKWSKAAVSDSPSHPALACARASFNRVVRDRARAMARLLGTTTA